MRRAETATLTWADYRAEFPIFESTTYLNTCSLAPLSRRVAAAVGEYLRLWQQFGASAWSGPWWGKTGIAAVTLNSPDGMTLPLEEYDRAVDDRTALVVGSHVYFTTGMVQDITALARLAHARGAACPTAAPQEAGQLARDG